MWMKEEADTLGLDDSSHAGAFMWDEMAIQVDISITPTPHRITHYNDFSFTPCYAGQRSDLPFTSCAHYICIHIFVLLNTKD